LTTPKTLALRNLAVNGHDWLLSKCAEECVELAGAILKHQNKGESEDAIFQEMGDVEIALETLSAVYGRARIEEHKAAKIARIEAKVKELEGENA
jgi:NTP pyrophosphatase (non-canonical NTP hydrolase)